MSDGQVAVVSSCPEEELNPPEFKRWSSSSSKWIKLNVGGKVFITTLSTLVNKEPDSMLARMFSQEGLQPGAIDSEGAFLIDRSAEYFEPIINYLRHGKLIFDSHLNPEGILEEAKFFGIEGLIPRLDVLLNTDVPLNRQQVINALIQTTNTLELRFQGINLAGADLQRLDLRHINFKYANMKRCNLSFANMSFCCLERADLSHANISSAQLVTVKGSCANMECANLQDCNFEAPDGDVTNLEGVNLKGACLEGSNMDGVNLRVANLKNANLKNCSMRGVVLAGADLEKCNLSGSDLQKANLRGANLTDTKLELILTPLHMSQTIR